MIQPATILTSIPSFINPQIMNLPYDIVQHIMDYIYGDPKMNKAVLIHEFKTRHLRLELNAVLSPEYMDYADGDEDHYFYAEVMEYFGDIGYLDRIEQYRRRYLKSSFRLHKGQRSTIHPEHQARLIEYE